MTRLSTHFRAAALLATSAMASLTQAEAKPHGGEIKAAIAKDVAQNTVYEKKVSEPLFDNVLKYYPRYEEPRPLAAENKIIDDCARQTVKGHAPLGGIFERGTAYMDRMVLQSYGSYTHAKTGMVAGPMIAYDPTQTGYGTVYIQNRQEPHNPKSLKPKTDETDILVSVSLDKENVLGEERLNTINGRKASARQVEGMRGETLQIMADFRACVMDRIQKDGNGHEPILVMLKPAAPKPTF